MKIVSFEVAKALKKAGYPQGVSDYQYTINGKERHYVNGYCSPTIIDAPYVMEVCLWLWREKGIKIVADPRQKVFVYIKADFYGLPKELASVFDDPEEAIEKAIEFLVNNDLIK